MITTRPTSRSNSKSLPVRHYKCSNSGSKRPDRNCRMMSIFVILESVAISRSVRLRGSPLVWQFDCGWMTVRTAIALNAHESYGLGYGLLWRRNVSAIKTSTHRTIKLAEKHKNVRILVNRILEPDMRDQDGAQSSRSWKRLDERETTTSTDPENNDNEEFSWTRGHLKHGLCVMKKAWKKLESHWKWHE